MCYHDSKDPHESCNFLPVLWISITGYNKDEKVVKKSEFIHSVQPCTQDRLPGGLHMPREFCRDTKLWKLLTESHMKKNNFLNIINRFSPNLNSSLTCCTIEMSCIRCFYLQDCVSQTFSISMVNRTLPFWLRLIMPLSSRSKGWDKGL